MGMLQRFREGLSEPLKEPRRGEAVLIMNQLIEKGLKPDEIDGVVNNYIQTGKLDIPARRERGVPYAPGTTDEVKLRKKARQLYSYDPQANVFVKGPREDDDTDIEVQRMTPEKGIGYDIILNRYTNEEVRRSPNKEGKNKYILTGTNPNAGRRGGSRKDTPAEALAKDTLRKYQTMVGKGIEPPPEFMDSARSAADLLGVELEQVQEDPSFLDDAQDAVADAADKIPATAGRVPRSKTSFGGAALRFKPKSGKPLTKDKAQEFFRQAGNDKAKARALAKKAGYTF